MFHVRFDGECPVFDGTCPVALLQKKELDAEVVLVRQEEMYQMLCTHRVLSQMLRERWIKGDDMELAQGEHVLRIDEVFLRAQEEVRRSVEIRRSVDSTRCVSLEAKRKRGALTQAMEGASGATDPHASGELVPGRQGSVPTTRVSIELEHRPVGGFEREREGPHGAMSEDEEEEEVDQQGHVVSKQRWHKETLSSTGSGALMEEARRISLEVRSRVSQEMKRMSQEVRRQIGRPGDNARQGEEQKLLSSFSKNDACDLSTIPDSPHAAPSPAVKPAPLVA